MKNCTISKNIKVRLKNCKEPSKINDLKLAVNLSNLEMSGQNHKKCFLNNAAKKIQGVE